MKIGPNTMVTLDYSLYLDSGELVETSNPQRPLAFLYGRGHIISGLERQLEGLEPGDEREVRVSPDEGYGDIDPAKIMAVDVGLFPPDMELEVGKTFYVQREGGEVLPFTVKEIAHGTVTIDFNHPLAGKHLNFRVTIREVREATQEEMEEEEEHGHLP